LCNFEGFPFVEAGYKNKFGKHKVTDGNMGKLYELHNVDQQPSDQDFLILELFESVLTHG